MRLAWVLLACAGVAWSWGCKGSAGAPGAPASGEPGEPGDPGTDGQVDGDPSISLIQPASVFLDRTVDVAISGFHTNWSTNDKPTIDFGDPQITVDAVTVSSETSLLVTLIIDSTATFGVRDVSVTDKDGTLTYKGVFRVDPPLDIGPARQVKRGSINRVYVKQRDLLNPLDSGNGINIIGAGTETHELNSLSAYTMGLELRVDTDAPLGSGDIVFQNGFGQLGVVESRSAPNIEVVEATPTALPVGTTMASVMNVNESIDYTVEVQSMQLVTITPTMSNEDAIGRLYVLPADGHFENAPFVENGPVTFVALPNETRHVIYYDWTEESGYDLELERSDEQVVVVTPPQTLTNTLSMPNQLQWYAVDASAGETIYAQPGPANGMNCAPNGPIQVATFIVDTDATTILEFGTCSFDGCSGNASTVPTSGTYFVVVLPQACFFPDAFPFDYSLDISVQ